ncbi:MAG: hypothetical protein AB1394_01765 [Bacteroidota bacterium]
MDGLVQILLGSLLLSLVHATIPSHWLPLIAISKTEKWSEKETVIVATITAIAHSASTVVLGIFVGMIGYQITESYHYITHYVAPVILILLGLIYFYLEYKHSKINTPHQHHHIDIDKIVQRKSKRSIVLSLSLAMFFSPCLEIEVYYLTASRLGWLGISVVSLVYFFVTVIGMVFLVYYGAKGVRKLQWHFLEHHDKLISGIVLILVGLLAFFVEF